MPNINIASYLASTLFAVALLVVLALQPSHVGSIVALIALGLGWLSSYLAADPLARFQLIALGSLIGAIACGLASFGFAVAV